MRRCHDVVWLNGSESWVGKVGPVPTGTDTSEPPFLLSPLGNKVNGAAGILSPNSVKVHARVQRIQQSLCHLDNK